MFTMYIEAPLNPLLICRTAFQMKATFRWSVEPEHSGRQTLHWRRSRLDTDCSHEEKKGVTYVAFKFEDLQIKAETL